MATLDASGLTISTQSEILAEIEAVEIAEIAAGLDLSTSSPIGQINRIVARRLRLLEEALSALFAGLDPDTATGDALLRLCALTGTYREPATASRVVVTVDLDAGTYAAGALAVYPAGRPEDRFTNAEEIVTAGGSEVVIFDAETTGAIAVGADTLVLVASTGFNSITSHPDATPGSEIETEAALRLRRAAEVASPGSASVAGIAADLTREVAAVETVQIIPNATDATVDFIPPHSVEAIVYGPASPTADDNDAVAASIFSSIAAGIGTYGNTTRTVYDAEGIAHSISFTRPEDVTISVAISVTVAASGYAGDGAVATAIATLSRVRPGLNASWSSVVAKAMSVAGVLRVSTVNLGSGAFVDVPIDYREIAVFDSGSVTVTSAVGAS